MSEQEVINYERVAKAIRYLQTNFRSQPSLEELASHLHLSPYHFQRLFTDWAGISPKKFVQYLSLNYAKTLLKKRETTLFEAAEETGLSGTGRLHDLFVKVEGMTPAVFKKGGQDLRIDYCTYPSPFGQLFIASTSKGICCMVFEEAVGEGLSRLHQLFPQAVKRESRSSMHANALNIFSAGAQIPEIKVHIKATDFQLKVWEALLRIPEGKVATYGQIATAIHSDGASRAVGTAIGQNPIAFLIPCHRVIQASGDLGGYRWDPIRKSAMIGWEAARREAQKAS